MIHSLEFQPDINPLDVNEEGLFLWLNQVAVTENKALGPLSIVVGSDEWLLHYNNEFLNHDYYTDIITFDYSDDGVVTGDLLISLDRVFDNSTNFNVSRETEFFRVCVHGVLHLCGYSDKTPSDEIIMRQKEDYYLSLL